MLLYIIRHGEPDYATDTLTERGRLQAEAVGKRLYDSKIQRIFSSPYGRAKETAEPACRLLGLEKNIEEWAHEIEDECLTTYPNGQKSCLWYLPNRYFLENGNNDLPYGSAYKSVGVAQSGIEAPAKYIIENGRIFLEKLGYREENGVYRILRNNDEKVALFCHGGISAVWLSHLLHIPIHIFLASFQVHTHTGVTVLHFRNNDDGITAPQCMCYSDMSHLYAANLDMRYENKIEV